jgi:uncharacterized protein (TIGR02217 family)
MTYLSFVEERISDGEILKNSTFGPSYSTRVSKTGNASEQRNINWDTAVCKGQLGERMLLSKQMDTLLAFFHARRGRAIGFRHKDWSDYIVKQSQGTLEPVANGRYQLFKTYPASSGLPGKRKILKPVDGTVKVYDSAFDEPIPVVVDHTTGIVTLPGGAIGALSWTGEFDVPVRFDVDELQPQFLQHERSTGQSLFQVFSLPIIELKNP